MFAFLVNLPYHLFSFNGLVNDDYYKLCFFLFFTKDMRLELFKDITKTFVMTKRLFSSVAFI